MTMVEDRDPGAVGAEGVAAQALNSTLGSLVQPTSPTGARNHRPGWPVIAFVAAAVAIIVAVAISPWWATSDSSGRPTRTIQSTTAAELAVIPATPVLRSANAAEEPVPSAPSVIRSTNAAEQPLPGAPARIGSTNAAEQPARPVAAP